MIVTIYKDFTFDAAHHLPHMADGHKCKRVHGHTYHLRVALRGDVDHLSGIVVDFAVISSIVKKHVLDVLDHHDMNTVIENPTAENIAAWILQRLRETHLHDRPYRVVDYVELRETDSSGIIVS